MNSSKLYTGLLALAISPPLASCTLRYVPPADKDSVEFLVKREEVINLLRNEEGVREIAKHISKEPKRYFIVRGGGRIKLRKADYIKNLGDWGFYIPEGESILGIARIGLDYKETLNKARSDSKELDGKPIIAASPVINDFKAYLKITDLFEVDQEIRIAIPQGCLEDKIEETLKLR